MYLLFTNKKNLMMENDFRDDIKKAVKFVETAVILSFSIGIILGGVIGALTSFVLMR